MRGVRPRVGDVWRSPLSLDVWLVVKVEKKYAWAVRLDVDVAKIEMFHLMNSPISASWTKIMSGEGT